MGKFSSSQLAVFVLGERKFYELYTIFEESLGSFVIRTGFKSSFGTKVYSTRFILAYKLKLAVIVK